MALSLQKSTLFAGVVLSVWSAAAGTNAQLLHPGETVRGVMPPGDPARTSVAFDLDTPQGGTITISASSIDFDTAVKVSQLRSDGSLSPLGEDDDGGTGSDSRIEVVTSIDGRYRIEVRSADGALGGEFELSVVPGKAPAARDASAKATEDLAYWKRAESAARERGNAIREARSLVGQGRALSALGEHAAVPSLCERATAIFESALPPDHPDLAESLGAVAILLWTEGEYARARPLLERVLAIREKTFGPEHGSTASALTNLAALLWDMGEYPPARPLLERALAIYEELLPPGDDGRALGYNNLARLLQDMGDYQTARTHFERALEIREKALGPENPFTALSLINLAVLYQAMGEYSEARPLLERALAIFERVSGPEDPYTAKGLNSLAQLLQTMGEYAAARPLLERALAIREKVNGPEHPDTATTLNSLCSLLQTMGEPAAARPRCERALAIRERALGPEHPDTAVSLGNLALWFQARGEYAAALPLYERALAIREKSLGPEHPATATSLASLADLLRLMRRYEEAWPLYERALAIRKKALGPEHPDVARDLAGLARLLARQGDAAGALDTALEAERIARAHAELTGRSLTERQALRYAAARTSSLDLILTLAARGLAPDQRRRAFDGLIRSRALVLDEMATRHRMVSGSADPAVARLAATLSAARARLANLAVRGLGDQAPANYRRLLDDARDEEERAERALAEASAGFARDLSRSRLGLDEVARSLPQGSALVALASYTSSELVPDPPGTNVAAGEAGLARELPSYIAFVLRAGELEPRVLDLGSAADIDRRVASWRNSVSSAAPRAGRRVREAEAMTRQVGVGLRKVIWDPLASALEGTRRVFIVPDGTLNLVSFAALPFEDGGYLIERGPLVHYVSAERDLVLSRGARRGDGLLALGAPSYDARSLFASLRRAKPEPAVLMAPVATYRGRRAGCGAFASARFEPLPATGEEVREIVRTWKKHGEPAPVAVLELEGTRASESEFKRAAPGRRVLHLATHGFFLGGECASALDSARGIGGLSERPQSMPIAAVAPVEGENPLVLSGLALAGANHRSAAGNGEDDGILTAEEIASLDLSGVEWAVLSACDTGVGDVHAGEGVFGLRRAFQVAGAGTLVMSLWPVDDEATRAWMKALYEARLDRHLDTAEAVSDASLKVLRARRARGVSTQPSTWAAFVAAGDWR